MTHIHPNIIRVDFLRHGETQLLKQFTKQGMLRGRTDDALTYLGWQQMQHSIDTQFSLQPWQAIISSPLQRCCSFAKHQASHHNLPYVEIDQLQEIDFGDWEGQSIAHLHATCPDLLERYWSCASQFTPPNAESLIQFASRIDTALDKIATLAYTYQYTHIGVVTHGGVIKYLHTKARSLPLDDLISITVALGQIHTLYYQHNTKQWQISSIV